MNPPRRIPIQTARAEKIGQISFTSTSAINFTPEIYYKIFFLTPTAAHFRLIFSTEILKPTKFPVLMRLSMPVYGCKRQLV